MKKLFILLLIAFMGFSVKSQETFDIELQEVVYPNFPGLQSYAIGVHNGKWLIIGGRVNGLHAHTPFTAFPVDSANKHMWVLDPVSGNVWSYAVSNLSTYIADQFSATNPAFHQHDTILYFAGGYGWVPASNDYKTHTFLTAINIPSTIDAIINNQSPAAFIRQIGDPRMAVTGSYMAMISSQFYLVGGHKFDGNYNPNGNPSYTQIYTNSIRRFDIIDNGTILGISNYQETIDAALLRKRDYNLLPQVLPNGNQGLMAFSGVFRQNINLPFFNVVEVSNSSHSEIPNFEQKLNQYHGACMPMYDSFANVSQNIFFGGISMYYPNSSGQLIEDSLVPFVKTISKVTRLSNGTMTETALPVEMPGYLGASAEFILNETTPVFYDEVINLNALPDSSNHVGYIFGGLESTHTNIFMSASSGTSVASKRLFKVIVKKGPGTGYKEMPVSNEKFMVYPNPANEWIVIKLDNDSKIVSWKIFDLTGKEIMQEVTDGLSSSFQIDISHLTRGMYFLSVFSENRIFTKRTIVE